MSGSTDLVIPDPRNQPVPIGWAETRAAPAIFGTVDWEQLDEYEARLRAFASYIDAFGDDVVEFEKALRILEKRRGDLLIAGTTRGTDDSKQTATRWRKIARHWDELWPLIRDTRNRRDVTQAALLRRIDNSDGAVIEPYEIVTPRHGQLADAAKKRLYAMVGYLPPPIIDEADEDIRRAAAVCSPEELRGMARAAKEHAVVLLRLSRKMEAAASRRRAS